MSADRKYLTGKTFTSFHKLDKHTKVYSKNFKKAKQLEFEVARNRDIIMKLKNDIYNKNKELDLLKVNKNTIEKEHFKTLKILKEFLKKSDNLTKETFKTVEKNLIENNNYGPYSDKEEDNPPKKIKYNRQNKYKKKMKDFIRIDSLKQHINNLNEELNRKNNIITELRSNKKATGYKELQNNFLNSCNEIKEMKKENMEMRNQIDNYRNLLNIERYDNKSLKNKLQDFKKKFKIYKEISINRVIKLDNQLNKAKEKEKNFKITKTTEKNNEKWNNYIKDLEYDDMKKKIDEYQIDIKKNNDIIKKIKSINFNQYEENKKLKNDYNNLITQNQLLKRENDEISNYINECKEKLKNYENEKKEWKEIDNENNKLKNELEQLKKEFEDMKLNENDNNIFFNDIEDKKKEKGENKNEEEKNDEKKDKNINA